MIVKAAVQFYIDDLDKVVTIPCHRHCDAFYILNQFGFKAHKGYKEIAQGFLDEHDNFYNRVEAFKHAQQCEQIDKNEPIGPLFSEELW